MSNWPIQFITWDKIIPHPQNPYKHKEGDRQDIALAASIGTFGNVGVGIWNRQTGHLIDGHARMKKFQSRGEQGMECRVVDWDYPTELKALATINRSANLVTIDPEAMLNLLENFDLPNDDLLGALWMEDDLLGLTSLLEANTSVHVEFEAQLPGEGGDAFVETIDPVSIPTRTRLGEIWKLGNHKLLIGDCLDTESVDRLFGDRRAAITFTSPPYNAGSSVQLTGNTHLNDQKSRYGDGTNDFRSDYLELLIAFTKEAKRRSDVVIVNLQMLAGNKIALLNYLHRFEGNLADIMVWDKGMAQPAMAPNVLNSRFEFVFLLDSCPDATRAIRTANFRGTVDNVYIGPPQRENPAPELHAAVMPTHLAEHFVVTFTAPHQIVYDPFAGLGTTLIACERHDRVAYLVEISPRYSDVILSRFEAETGEKAWLLEEAL